MNKLEETDTYTDEFNVFALGHLETLSDFISIAESSDIADEKMTCAIAGRLIKMAQDEFKEVLDILEKKGLRIMVRRASYMQKIAKPEQIVDVEWKTNHQS